MKMRGMKHPMPMNVGEPTGILSSKGKQKMDSTASSPNKPLKEYALSAKGRKAPVKRDNMTRSGS